MIPANSDITMNGNNIGSTNDLSLYIYGTQNYLTLDQYGNVILNNASNNPIGSTGGSLDFFVNWDGANIWGPEVLLNNTVVQIRTNSGTNTWTFDDASDLTLAGDIISPYSNITNVNNIENDTNAISIYNHTGGTSNGKIMVTNTDVIINTNNGANVWTFDTNGVLSLPNLEINSGIATITTPVGSTGGILIQ